MTTPQEPVALLLKHRGGDTELAFYNHGGGCLTAADKKAGWTETPLYANPSGLVEAENARLRKVIADLANTINIVGSPYDKAQKALAEMVSSVKQTARQALAQHGGAE